MDRELERILKELTSELGDLVKVLGSTNKKVIENSKSTKQEIENKKRTIKSMRDYVKVKEKTGSAVDAFKVEIEEAADEVTNFEKKLEAIPSPLGLLKKGFELAKDAVMALAGAALKTAFNFGKTDSQIRSLGDAVDAGIADLGFLGKGAKMIADELDDNIQMFKGLAQSGATFNSSIMDMRNAAFQAGMPLVQFQELIQENSTTLARLFGTVNQGIPNFVRLGRDLRRITMDELSGFGLTLDDTNEFLTTQAEILRAQGRAELVNDRVLLANTIAYAKQLTLLSRLTGESVKELDAQRRARAADGVLQAKLAQMSLEDQRKFQAVLDLFPKGAQQAVMELGLLEAPISAAAKSLEVLGGGAVKDIIDSAMNTVGALSEEATVELSNRIKVLGSEIQGSSIADAFATAALAGGDAFFKEGLDLITAMAGSAANIEAVTQASKDARDGTTNELVKTQDALQLNTVALQNLGTAILGRLVLEDESMGARVLESFNRDAGQTSQEMVDAMKTMFGLGGAKRPSIVEFFTRDGGGTTGFEDILDFNKGSNGFQNFGSGTPAMLHGVEAVVPQNDFAQALKVLGEVAGTDTTTSSAPVSTTVPNSNNQVFTQLADSNERIANTLNTLVTIGTMTEKNTKDTKIAIANSGGSLV